MYVGLSPTRGPDLKPQSQQNMPHLGVVSTHRPEALNSALNLRNPHPRVGGKRGQCRDPRNARAFVEIWGALGDISSSGGVTYGALIAA